MVAARRLAADSGCTVLLKGAATIVADPDGEALVVTAGDARLATAGTGDVLERNHRRPAGQRHGAVARRCGRGVGARPGGSARPTTRLGRQRPARPDSGGAGRTAVSRWAWADVDLDADSAQRRGAVLGRRAGRGVGRREGRRVRPRGGPGLPGGAATAARPGLCVALVQEGVALREAGLDCPILVLSEQPADGAGRRRAVLASISRCTPYGQLVAIAAAGGDDHPVHLKIDTGHAPRRCRGRRRIGPRSGDRRVDCRASGRSVHPSRGRRRARRPVQRRADRDRSATC